VAHRVRRLRALRRVATLLTLLAAAFPAWLGAQQPRPKVLVIGVDGVRPDVLAEVDTPHIDGLIANGLYTDQARTGFPSVSGPGWSSFLIGVWPDKHGVTNNQFENKNYGPYPDFLTRIEQVRPELNTYAVADWLPLVADDSNGPVISDAVDVVEVLNGYDYESWRAADIESVDRAVAHLTSADPDALFVYLGDPDETSHQTGSIGEPYREAIRVADEQIGRLLAAVEARPTRADEDWLVVMSTDHGRRADGAHGGNSPEERTIFFLVSGASVEPSVPLHPVGVVDVPVTALAHLGIEIDPAWRLDGKPVGR